MSGPRSRATNRLSNLVSEGGRSREYSGVKDPEGWDIALHTPERWENSDDTWTTACRWDGEAWPCYPVLRAAADALAKACEEPLVILKALDLSVQWELAPDIKRAIHDATPKLLEALGQYRAARVGA